MKSLQEGDWFPNTKRWTVGLTLAFQSNGMMSQLIIPLSQVAMSIINGKRTWNRPKRIKCFWHQILWEPGVFFSGNQKRKPTTCHHAHVASRPRGLDESNSVKHIFSFYLVSIFFDAWFQPVVLRPTTVDIV